MPYNLFYKDKPVEDLYTLSLDDIRIAELDLSYSPLYAPVWDPLLVAANRAVKEV